VDAVILSADAMKQELFYVGASRGRQEIVVVTSDREQLRNLLGISTARPSATELVRESNRRLIPRQCLTLSGRPCRPLNRRCCGKRIATGTIWESVGDKNQRIEKTGGFPVSGTPGETERLILGQSRLNSQEMPCFKTSNR